MNGKRLLSFLLILILLLGSLSLPAFAADEVTDEEEITEAPTEKPTEAPTEPPLTPQIYGYQGYADLLDKTVYDRQLGAAYTPDATTFKVWSPVADDMKVCIYKTGSDDEKGAHLVSTNTMKYSAKAGTWYLTLEGDYKNLYYTYQVTIDGDTREVVDPYAKAVGVNGDRGMIIDLDETDPEGWEDDSFARVRFGTEAIVWEANIRDFSASPSSGVTPENRGKYLAFTETGTTLGGEGDIATCVDYLKDLGVNYVQIGPFYDFASVDESEDLSGQYNWGYDPKNYNVPEGSYASDPYDGRVRIKECKQMIQALHSAGIGVIMDVVYNHTYESENSFFNQLVPNYYYRISEDGKWSNGSGCGNDIASERYMVRRFIRDSVVYWAQEYHIDGFRFDLMGLTDTVTMNDIRGALDELSDGKKILTYGEAWNLDSVVKSDVKLANQNNLSSLSKFIGAFNDAARDAIKGSNFNPKEQGFVQSGSSKAGVREGIEAQSSGGWAAVPNQCVNYVSCHDNLTLYDKLTASVYGDDKYRLRRNDLVEMNKLAASIVMTSYGMPFMLAGEEMGRSKDGDDNSYQSSVELNRIDWNNLTVYTSLVDYYKGLIDIRRHVALFRDATGQYTTQKYLSDTPKEVIAYTVAANASDAKAVVIFNGSSTKSAEVTLPDGEWAILADGSRAGTASLGSAAGSITVRPSSSVILLDQESQTRIAGDGKTKCYVYAQYVDVDTGAVIHEDRYEGVMGDTYHITTPDHIVFNYDAVSSNAKTDGTFSSPCDSVQISVRPYDGDFSTVTVHFRNENDEEIANSIRMTNRIDQPYYTPSIPGIVNYTLDLEKLPDNGAGVYTKKEIDVIYRFKPYSLEDAEVSPDMTSRANVIYMTDDGEILDTKSYMGTYGDVMEIDYQKFKDYEFVSVTESEPVFGSAELNIVLYYHSTKTFPYMVLVIAAAALLIVLLIMFLIATSRRKSRMNSILVDD